MFYRYTPNNVRLACDLDDLFLGGECVITGGAPCLQAIAEKMNNTRGIPILAINNSAVTVRPTMWVGGDKPICIDDSILMDSTIMKFAVTAKRHFDVGGKPWYSWANTFFFGTKEGFNKNNFLNRNRDLAWWKNTFFIAIQLAYRLGFRTVYLAGCGFKIEKNEQYAWETKLDDSEVEKNARLYRGSTYTLKSLLPHFEKRGFKVVSITQDSLANEFLEYEDAASVIERLSKKLPPVDTARLPHSSKSGAVAAAK